MKVKAHQCKDLGHDFIIYDNNNGKFSLISEIKNGTALGETVAIPDIKFCPYCGEKLHA